jgi:hypothetical protein
MFKRYSLYGGTYLIFFNYIEIISEIKITIDFNYLEVDENKLIYRCLFEPIEEG